MSGERLLGIMRKTGAQAIPPESRTDILYETVTSISPLKVSIDNRFEVTQDFLTLSPFCYDHIITFNEDEAHTHTVETYYGEKTTSTYPGKQISVTVWQGLRVGDKVRLLRYRSGQMFYILDKGEIV